MLQEMISLGMGVLELVYSLEVDVDEALRLFEDAIDQRAKCGPIICITRHG